MPITMSRYTSRLMLVLGAAAAFSAAPVLAQGSKPIQTQDTNISGVVAELIECKRDDGVLTVRVRFRNTTDKKVRFVKVVANNNFDAYYVTAGSKKYLMMRDPQKMTLSPQTLRGTGNLSVDIDKGGTYQWWAKYPAPAADVKTINYYTPLTASFDNVPISD